MSQHESDELAKRGTGRTTRQIQAAPLAAVYVWPNGETSYPRELALGLGRNDLRVMSAEAAFADHGARLLGLAPGKVVIDHAVELNAERRLLLARVLR